MLVLVLVYIYVLSNISNSVCGNDFGQHIPLRKPRRSQNEPKPIPDYHPD